MGRAGVLERRAARCATTSRAQTGPPASRTSPARADGRCVVVAPRCSAATARSSTFTQTKQLSVGEIRLSVSPGHQRRARRLRPARRLGRALRGDPAARAAARRPADGRPQTRHARRDGGAARRRSHVRTEARDAIAGYLKRADRRRALLAARGARPARRVRDPQPHRAATALVTGAVAVGTALAVGVALVVLLPPRGAIDTPQYYAHGADIPRALRGGRRRRALRARALDQELDAQLVGLARLVTRPRRAHAAGRAPATDDRLRPAQQRARAARSCERAADGGPVLFPGDLTDRGSPLETRVVRQVVHVGNPFVFVSGNHDSDTLERRARRRRRDRADPVRPAQPRRLATARSSATSPGCAIAGYSDPFERRAREDFARPLRRRRADARAAGRVHRLAAAAAGRVDVVMVHEPALIEPALAVLNDDPPPHPIVFVVGHTHKAALDTQPGVDVINGGSDRRAAAPATSPRRHRPTSGSRG